ncbi:MAG: saccharopine dehydrogenase C-terminal domain-containing protein [Bacteroidota bacterium]
MKLTVLGAGPIGSAIACDLASRPEVTHVQVCDARSGTLHALKERLHNPKLRTVRVDVRDERALAPVLSGSTCVVGSGDASLNPKLAALAVGLGAHFCDLGGDDRAVQQELALHDTAARRSRWIVPNCGLAPGLVNVLVLHGLDRFDEVEAVTMRVGNIPVEAEAPLFHRLGYGVERLVMSYTTPAPAMEGGALRTVEPLTGLEAISFEAPFEDLEAFHTAGKLSTLPLDLQGRVQRLDYKTLRHPGHAAAMRAVLALGFGEDRSVDVRTHLSYRDLLTRRLRQRIGGTPHDAVLVRIRLDGRADGEARALTFELVDRYDEATGFTAMQRSTSFPAAAVAMLLATGVVPGGGAAPPERIVPPEPYFGDLAAHGLGLRQRWDDEPFEPVARSATAEA